MFWGRGVCEEGGGKGIQGHCDLAAAGGDRGHPSYVTTRLFGAHDGGTGVDVLLVRRDSALVVLDKELGY